MQKYSKYVTFLIQFVIRDVIAYTFEIMEAQLGAIFFDIADSDNDEVFSTSSEFSSEDDTDGDHPKLKEFVETINEYEDDDFISHFCLHRGTALLLIEWYNDSAYIPMPTGGGRKRVGAEAEIYAYIWYISNTCTFRELGNLFGIAKSTAWRIVSRVAKWLISLSHIFIKWPQEDEFRIESQKFEDKRGIPGVIGAIDCTHVTIKKPMQNSVDYFDKKNIIA